MSREKVSFRPLALGDPDALVPLRGKRTPAMEAVDKMLLDNAHKALVEVGVTALEFLATNPDASTLELAKRLNRGASAMGLTMAIYEEAINRGLVRQIAMELLNRKLREKYAEGWTSGDTISAVVRIGGWYDDIRRSVRNEQVQGHADQIIRELAINNPPPDGWKPEMRDDPLVTHLFDRFWPFGNTG